MLCSSAKLMAQSRNCQLCISFTLAIIIFFSFTLQLPPQPGGIEESSLEWEVRKMVLGSRPPGCMNKCMSCRPCEATLVIPPHNNKDVSAVKIRANAAVEETSHREDDSYYLLSWKCRCGSKIYQP